MLKSPTLYVLILALACLPITAQTRDISPALVRLKARCDSTARSGTGFIVALKDASAFIATAQHVVAGCEITAAFASAPTIEHRAHVHLMDQASDLALLRVEGPPSGLRYLSISSRAPNPGSLASLAGYPRGALEIRFETPTVSNLEGSMLSLTGAAAAGSSGSPLLRGDTVVGIVVQVMGNYPKAVPGRTLGMVLGGWLGSILSPEPKDAQRQIQVVVTDPLERPIEDFTLRRGGQETAPTSDTGATSLQLSSKDETGMAVQLRLGAAFATDWILATRQLNVPHEEEPESVQVVVMRKKDFRDLASESFDRVSRPEHGEMTLEERRDVIVDFANARGLSEGELKEAILSLSETDNLMDQGIASLMTGAYLEAEEQFRVSLARAKQRIHESEDDAARRVTEVTS